MAVLLFDGFGVAYTGIRHTRHVVLHFGLFVFGLFCFVAVLLFRFLGVSCARVRHGRHAVLDVRSILRRFFFGFVVGLALVVGFTNVGVRDTVHPTGTSGGLFLGLLPGFFGRHFFSPLSSNGVVRRFHFERGLFVEHFHAFFYRHGFFFLSFVRHGWDRWVMQRSFLVLLMLVVEFMWQAGSQMPPGPRSRPTQKPQELEKGERPKNVCSPSAHAAVRRDDVREARDCCPARRPTQHVLLHHGQSV